MIDEKWPDPSFTIAFLYHVDPGLFSRAVRRCMAALTTGTSESYEAIIRADGPPNELVPGLMQLAREVGIDEVQVIKWLHELIGYEIRPLGELRGVLYALGGREGVDTRERIV